ncbi:hypothetical protein AS299_23160 [Citrobacter freundii]|nr:hypothetical protein AS299_23160 [Citrobacter freundii]
MIVRYLPELLPEMLKWAEAFVRVAITQVDNALCFWFPADNTDRHSAVVFEPSVKFAHRRFALRL